MKVTPECLVWEPGRMELHLLIWEQLGKTSEEGRFKEEIGKLTAHETVKRTWHLKENQLL